MIGDTIHHHYMTEEGLFDSDPSYVRSALYAYVFGKNPVAGYEVRHCSIDQEKLLAWIGENGFETYHTKFVEHTDEGEEKIKRYYINKKTEIMITLIKVLVNPNRDILMLTPADPSYTGSSSNQEQDPNEIFWFSYYGPSEEEVLAFKKTFGGLKIKEDSKNKLYMLKSSEFGGVELDSFPVTCGEMSLELNYGNTFMPMHEHIVDNLLNKKSGLYIFHGPAGTGKTSYIKFLTTVIDKRKFIFVPNTMVTEIFAPKLVDKLYSFKNAVLVLEDAEICVFKRDGKNNELVSSLLNITDGLLKDLLNISIIVTFNTADVSEIDTALLRKGRLKIIHNFGLLSIEDATKLATHLGKKKAVTGPLSLADVYNLDEETGVEEVVKEKRVGFTV